MIFLVLVEPLRRIVTSKPGSPERPLSQTLTTASPVAVFGVMTVAVPPVDVLLELELDDELLLDEELLLELDDELLELDEELLELDEELLELDDELLELDEELLELDDELLLELDDELLLELEGAEAEAEAEASSATTLETEKTLNNSKNRLITFDICFIFFSPSSKRL